MIVIHSHHKNHIRDKAPLSYLIYSLSILFLYITVFSSTSLALDILSEGLKTGTNVGYYRFNKITEYKHGIQFGTYIQSPLFAPIQTVGHFGFIRTLSKKSINSPVILSTIMSLNAHYPLDKFDMIPKTLSTYFSDYLLPYAIGGLGYLSLDNHFTPRLGLGVLSHINDTLSLKSELIYEGHLSLTIGIEQYLVAPSKRLTKKSESPKKSKTQVKPPPFRSPLFIQITHNIYPNTEKNISSSVLNWIQVGLKEELNVPNNNKTEETLTYAVHDINLKNKNTTTPISRLESAELMMFITTPLKQRPLNRVQKNQLKTIRFSSEDIPYERVAKHHNIGPDIYSINSYKNNALISQQNSSASLLALFSIADNSSAPPYPLNDIDDDYLFKPYINHIIHEKYMSQYKQKNQFTFKSSSPILKHHFIIFMSRVYASIAKEKGLPITPNTRQSPLLPTISKKDRINVSAMINAFGLTPNDLKDKTLKKPLSREDAVMLAKLFLKWRSN